MPDEWLRGFLADGLKTDAVMYGGGTLYRHLVQTHDGLTAWGNPPDICRAGLFHCIYGTHYFPHVVVPFHQRRLITMLIGPEAEQLAYLFCVTQHPEALLAQWGRSEIVVSDRRARDLVVLTQRELLALLEVEAFSLLDRIGSRKEDGDCDLWLKQFAKLPLSRGARTALQAWL
jgi:hypothetical protein